MNNLKHALHSALVNQFRVDRTGLDEDTKLFSSGLIDSLNVMDLVFFVESQIGQAIPPADITLENFDTINRIVLFAEKLHSETGDK